VPDDPSFVLIGPANVGKSTVAPRLAEILGRGCVDLDQRAAEYYEEAGQPVSRFAAEIERRGYPEAARWWQPARSHAVARVVEDHPSSVIALGAGHSHYEDRSYFDQVRAALSGLVVVFLLPYPERERSLDLLRSRTLEGRGHNWVREGVDYLTEWIDSEQNRALASRTVFVGDLDPLGAAQIVATPD
jgi:shikimate kinase